MLNKAQGVDVGTNSGPTRIFFLVTACVCECDPVLVFRLYIGRGLRGEVEKSAKGGGEKQE